MILNENCADSTMENARSGIVWQTNFLMQQQQCWLAYRKDAVLICAIF